MPSSSYLKVLKTMEKNACAPPPFPLNAQYVSTIMAAKNGQAGENDSENENEETLPTTKKPKKTKKDKGDIKKNFEIEGVWVELQFYPDGFY